MDSARRSSRASRASQPLQSNSHHSSASSNSSSRADRATRQHQKTQSPRKVSPDEAVATVEMTEPENGADDNDNEGENGEDDEAVRCICGFEEFPGPPQLDDGIEEVTEDASGFYLQCDMCKVWQHGFCVGITNEDQSPDEYFCEECRKDLHKVFTDKNGQRFSHYLPLYQSLSRTTSRAASFSKDGTRSPRSGSKSGRPSSSLQSAKRRSTMNSRDAAYDEEEQLRRAIEASKGEKSGESTDGGGTIRRGKRGRSDSEEKPDDAKRQRTQSASPSIPPEQNQTPQADSDDGTNGRQGGAKKIRGAAARNHREKELREERERSRQEAASKRRGRAERRRVDAIDSDPSEELPLAARASVSKSTEVAAQPLDPPPSSQAATPDTPPPPPSTSHRKGGRPPNARKGKLGKNQYTKDRDLQEGDDLSPHRSMSRDVPRGDDNGHTSGNKGSNSEGKPGKSKNNTSKVTMGDMRKRVGAILDYISRTQLEMAGEAMSPATADAAEKTIRGIADGLPMIKVNGENGDEPKAEENSKKEFKDLTCLEMMDVLTRQLVKWQKEFA